MDNTIQYLAGYLTEIQWKEAFGCCPASEVAHIARQVQERWCFKFENDKLQALVDKN